MIDAFKPEYLKYAPYLSSLTKKYQWGELEMPPGHNGGMEIFFRGHSTKLATFYKKKESKLEWVKYFIWLDNFGWFGRFKIECIINFFRLFGGKDLHRIGKIPLKKIYKFDFSDDKPPHRRFPVKYTYFGALDELGHKYGPKSEEIRKEIQKIDSIIAKKDFNIILSDHGMIEVSKTASVPLSKNCFIDSDMARYWGNKAELEAIKKKLPLEFGKILNWPNKRYGDLIFLANPGVLISPNYWYGKEKVKGMHGYDGRNKDMKGIYILKKEGKKKNLHVKQLHKKFREMLNKSRI